MYIPPGMEHVITGSRMFGEGNVATAMPPVDDGIDALDGLGPVPVEHDEPTQTEHDPDTNLVPGGDPPAASSAPNSAPLTDTKSPEIEAAPGVKTITLPSPQMDDTDDDDDDALAPNQTVRLCLRAIDSLRRSDNKLGPQKRRTKVVNALEKLRADVEVSPPVLGGLASALHELAPREYEVWAMSFMRGGGLFIMATNPFSPRAVNNLLGLLRPHLIAQMRLETACEIALLDGALAAYANYNITMLGLKCGRHVMAGLRDEKGAMGDARLTATAESSLRLYLSTLEKLQARTRRPVLNIQHANAVQVNAGGSYGTTPAGSQEAV
ncbi:MAG: hypothetical protein NTV86_04370 [Planctomycetota bacterium]|nr:hypothetical protein [Planctomycetota bacterium]